MANPFLVLGGIAVGIVTAAFGILQVPGWITSAQDAAAINDLSNIRLAQAATASGTGAYAADFASLSGEANGVKLDLSGNDRLAFFGVNATADDYCAIIESDSGSYFGTSKTVQISDKANTKQEAVNLAGCSFVQDFEPSMVFRIDTTAAGCVAPALNLQARGARPVDATITWGDGTAPLDAVTGANKHTFAKAGVYDVLIEGSIPSFGSMGAGAAECVTAVPRWGETETTSTSQMFVGARNLTAVEAPPASLTDMTAMFMDVKGLKVDVSGWDFGNVTVTANMFSKATGMSTDVTKLDMSSVTNATGMFSGNADFNQDVSGWNTSKLSNAMHLFYGTAFNGDVSNWATSELTSANGMFELTPFNKPLKWENLRKLEDAQRMFASTPFNQPLDWDVPALTNVRSMFQEASAFNQDLQWRNFKPTLVANMFFMAPAFDGSVAGWNTENVFNMQSVFMGASSFTGKGIETWKTHKVDNMSNMFQMASKFTGDVTGWDTSKVTNFSSMFTAATAFKRDLSGWSTASATRSSSFGSGSGMPASYWPKFS